MIEQCDNTNSVLTIESSKGLWLFVSPIQGVQIEKDCKYIHQIDKVTLMSGNKVLPYLKKRGVDVNNLRTMFFDKFSSESSDKDCFAICELGGAGDEKINQFIKLIDSELGILSLSQLGYSRRRHNANISAINHAKGKHFDYFMYNIQKKSYISSGANLGRFFDLKINKNWVNFHNKCFYHNLIKIIRENSSISDGWRKNIYDASYLAGKSQSCDDLCQAFLWNMIAIETLLTDANDSYSKILPKRVECFIGWTKDWKNKSYESKIDEIYKKRCKFVHTGDRENITIKDILFTDILLMNIFYNIVKHIKIFPNKESLIEFSRKIEAEHILGIKSKVRPKTISYFELQFSQSDYERI